MILIDEQHKWNETTNFCRCLRPIILFWLLTTMSSGFFIFPTIGFPLDSLDHRTFILLLSSIVAWIRLVLSFLRLLRLFLLISALSSLYFGLSRYIFLLDSTKFFVCWSILLSLSFCLLLHIFFVAEVYKLILANVIIRYKYENK